MGQRSYSDKIDTFVEFPPGLDLSDWMPSSEPGAGDDDPQTQSAPYRYELYGVTNHVGNLSSGHCEFSILFTCNPADSFPRYRVREPLAQRMVVL